MPISRRDFLKMSALTGFLPFSLNSKAVSINSSKLFVNLALDGGPDFRHLIVPPYSNDTSSYAYRFWQARAAAHYINANDQNALSERFQNSYTNVTVGNQTFGVLNSCDWLVQQFNAGNVAMINNAVFSTNRDHPHSILMRECGNLTATAHDLERSGWGGRLAQQAGKKIISVSQNVKLFCNGEKVGEPLKHDNQNVIDMSDSRKSSLLEFNLATADNNTEEYRIYWDDAKMKRALKSYYTALSNEIDSSSPYATILKNEQILRQFGQQIDTRLANYSIPSSIKAFYDWDDKSGNLSNTSFGTQIRNLYDAILCQDVLDMGIVSLDYQGWDSHKRTSEIENKFADILGLGKGFDTLYKELELVSPDSWDNMVIMISGEFGRQLGFFIEVRTWFRVKPLFLV